jgi:hypothetical protein
MPPIATFGRSPICLQLPSIHIYYAYHYYSDLFSGSFSSLSAARRALEKGLSSTRVSVTAQLSFAVAFRARKERVWGGFDRGFADNNTPMSPLFEPGGAPQANSLSNYFRNIYAAGNIR